MVVPYEQYRVSGKSIVRAKHSTLSELCKQSGRAAYQELVRRVIHSILLLFLLWAMYAWSFWARSLSFLRILIFSALLFVTQQITGVLLSMCF